MEKTIIYTIDISKGLCVSIPKKFRNGYIKAAFGGHHISDKNRLFLSEIAEITNNEFSADIYDVDGYLFFYGNFFEDEIKDILTALFKVFPYVTQSKKLSRDEFLDLTPYGK